MICRDCPSILIRNSDGRCFCERSEEEVMPDWKCHIKNDDPLGRQMYYGDDDPFRENHEARSPAAYLCMDDIVVVPYHPDVYWKEYQQDQTYEKMTCWLKHRAWYLWMQEEARRIVSERDMHMAMLPTAKRDMLEDFSQGLMDAARRTDRGCQ